MKKNLMTMFMLMVFCSSAVFAEDNSSKEKQGSSENKAINTCTIKGKVLDNKIGETLAGATVVINGTKVFTDLEGNFEVRNIVPDSKCEILINMISYKPEKLNINTAENSYIEIKLKQ